MNGKVNNSITKTIPDQRTELMLPTTALNTQQSWQSMNVNTWTLTTVKSPGKFLSRNSLWFAWLAARYNYRTRFFVLVGAVSAVYWGNSPVSTTPGCTSLVWSPYQGVSRLHYNEIINWPDTTTTTTTTTSSPRPCTSHTSAPAVSRGYWEIDRTETQQETGDFLNLLLSSKPP